MSFVSFSALACPLDGDPMHREGQAWRCAAGHSYDIARQGYTHLLPVQHKRSRDPGDSKGMVAARQRFLNAGHYQPVAEAVAGAVLAKGSTSTTLHCLDAGCGEGYYLRQLAQADSDVSLSLLGLDISKWAVLAAAKQERGATRQEEEGRASWVVASNANLPVQDGSLDCVLCLFGFPAYPEFVRVLKPGGVLIQADVGPDHLRELREIIYPSLKPERERPALAPDGLIPLEVETIRYVLTLEEPQAVADLLAMTPHLYRASAEGRAKAEALTSLSVTIDVRLRRLERLA
ncbi:putative RNA methyltransferase [Salinicola sp. CPA57]|uniref:putative RNA methyltransferase n=1 Tax=Salinicola sp. CPA57 TaxID=1949080 RepID=UPI000DA266A8|nr:methyltransferase domain-containing protein [Salinicola sp. CPA57]